MTNFNDLDLPSFSDWYKEHYPDKIPHKPNFSHVIYFELCASGEGVQIDEDTFNEYLNLFKTVDTFSYSYDRQNDCTVYKIDDKPVLRLYKWGCLI